MATTTLRTLDERTICAPRSSPFARRLEAQRHPLGRHYLPAYHQEPVSIAETQCNNARRHSHTSHLCQTYISSVPNIYQLIPTYIHIIAFALSAFRSALNVSISAYTKSRVSAPGHYLSITWGTHSSRLFVCIYSIKLAAIYFAPLVAQALLLKSRINWDELAGWRATLSPRVPRPSPLAPGPLSCVSLSSSRAAGAFLYISRVWDALTSSIDNCMHKYQRPVAVRCCEPQEENIVCDIPLQMKVNI